MKNLPSAKTLFYKLKYQREVNSKLREILSKPSLLLQSQYEIEIRLKKETERLNSELCKTNILLENSRRLFDKVSNESFETATKYNGIVDELKKVKSESEKTYQRKYDLERMLENKTAQFAKLDKENKIIIEKLNKKADHFESLAKEYNKLNELYKLEQQKKTPILTKIKIWLNF